MKLVFGQNGVHTSVVAAAHPHASSEKPTKVTITELVRSSAKFNGKRCVPSCAHAKRFELKFERVDKLQVTMKNMRPHRPTE
jgi:hypothetical protein